MLSLWVLVLFAGFASGVLYRPDYSPRMKNTTYRWNVKAHLTGPNVCAREIIWGNSPRTYDVAWTGGALCTPTSVKFECCEGFSRLPGEQGCTLATDLLPALTAASNAKAGWTLRLLSSSGLDSFLEANYDPVTIFAPDDMSASALSSHSRRVLEDGAERASRLIDAPPILLSHVVPGRRLLQDFSNDEMVKPLSSLPSIRINKYPNGLVTANCVPVVARDITTTGPLLHTVASILPQGYFFPIADTVLRDVQSRKFASYLAQAHLETLLRSEGPFTLLLPTDEAMDRLSHHHVHALRYDDVALTALVLNHVLNGVHCSAMLNNAAVTSRQGETLKARCRGTGAYIEDATVTTTDKMATNGVLHTIDKVLVPRRAKLVLDVLRDLGLTKLVSLIERGGLVSTFLSPDAFTIFAPTNEALSTLPLYSERDARNIVLNHMSENRVLTSSVKSYEEIPSKGVRRHLALRVLRQKVLVDTAVVLEANLETLNGVIHIIDRVVPEPNRKTVLQYLRENGQYTHFLYALRITHPAVFSRLETPTLSKKFTIFAVADTRLAPSVYYRAEVGLMGNHIVEKELLSEQVPSNGSLSTPTVGSGNVLLVRRGASFYAGTSYVMQRDILCSDGVIHLVRDVILAPRRYFGNNY